MTHAAFIDTNIILRYLLYDNVEQNRAAVRLLREASEGGVVLHLAASTVSEVVFVLNGRIYQRSREQIVEALRLVLQLPIRLPDAAEVELALDLFENHHDDWDDCLLSAYALTRTEGRLYSFDHGLSRIPGLQLLNPS